MRLVKVHQHESIGMGELLQPLNPPDRATTLVVTSGITRTIPHFLPKLVCEFHDGCKAVRVVNELKVFHLYLAFNQNSTQSRSI